MENLIEYLKSRLKNLDDIYFRELNIKNKKVFIAFSDALIDSSLVSNFVIRSLVDIISSDELEDKNNLKSKIEEKIGINSKKLTLKIVLQ